MISKFPALSYCCLLLLTVFGVALFPQPFYWIHGDTFDFVQLMQQTVTESGVRLRTSALVPLILAVSSETVLIVLVFASALPAIVAIVMASLSFGKQGVITLISRLRPWLDGVTTREGLKIWGAATLFVLSVQLTTYLVRHVMGSDIRGTLSWNDKLFTIAFFWLVLEAMFLNQGGLLEELGIRGYLQPLLNNFYRSPLKAALVVGLLWAIFHIPRDIMFDSIQAMGLVNYLIFFTLFALWCVGGSVVIAYFFNKTGGSALIAIATHGLLNDSMELSGVMSNGPYVMITRTLIVVLFAVALAWWAGPRLGAKEVQS